MPNRAYIQGHIPQMSGLHGTWVRPEKLDIYETYFDVCEFENDGPTQERAFYRIYFEDKSWPNDMNSLIFGLNTNIDDRYLQSFVTGIVTISCLVSSIVLAKKIKQKGIIYGAIFGLVYCLLIYILNTCIYGNFFISNTLLVYLGVCALSGIVGGIIGVNV